MEARRHITFAPSIKVRNIQRSLDFYSKILGFRITEAHTLENKHVVRAAVGFDSTLIVLSLINEDGTLQTNGGSTMSKPGNGVEFCINMIESNRFDEILAELTAKDITVVNKPVTSLRGNRAFTITDPDGYVVSFGEAVDTVTPQKTSLRIGQPLRATRNMPYDSIFGIH